MPNHYRNEEEDQAENRRSEQEEWERTRPWRPDDRPRSPERFYRRGERYSFRESDSNRYEGAPYTDRPRDRYDWNFERDYNYENDYDADRAATYGLGEDYTEANPRDGDPGLRPGRRGHGRPPYPTGGMRSDYEGPRGYPTAGMRADNRYEDRPRRGRSYGGDQSPNYSRGDLGYAREGAFYQDLDEPAARRGWDRTGPFSGMGPKNYRRSDASILEEACERLTRHGRVDARDIELDVKDGNVTLRGSVPQRPMKRLAEDAVEAISGVQEVFNELRLRTQDEQHGGLRGDNQFEREISRAGGVSGDDQTQEPPTAEK
jgi:hypothetical protein